MVCVCVYVCLCVKKKKERTLIKALTSKLNSEICSRAPPKMILMNLQGENVNVRRPNGYLYRQVSGLPPPPQTSHKSRNIQAFTISKCSDAILNMGTRLYILHTIWVVCNFTYRLQNV